MNQTNELRDHDLEAVAAGMDGMSGLKKPADKPADDQIAVKNTSGLMKKRYQQ